MFCCHYYCFICTSENLFIVYSRFAIDRGGTFTEVFCLCPGGKVRVMKLLSVDPANYPDAPREGIRRILESETKMKMPAEDPIDTSLIQWIRIRVAMKIFEGFGAALFKEFTIGWETVTAVHYTRHGTCFNHLLH